MTTTTTRTTRTTKPRVRHTASKSRPVQKTHGGKAYLARRLISLFPDDINAFGEPFVGGGSVFLNLRPDLYRSAWINDLHEPTFDLWDTLRDPSRFPAFHEAIRLVRYTDESFCYHRDRPSLGPTDAAVKQFCTNRMSRGGMGKELAWSDRLRGGKPGDLNAWETAVADLPLVHRHLAAINLKVTQIDAVKVVSHLGHDRRNFLYLDPPYVPTTRTTPIVYAKEMDVAHHVRLLSAIRMCRARVMISGYPSPLYDRFLRGWHRASFDMPNHAGQGLTKQRRTEVVWMNYLPR